MYLLMVFVFLLPVNISAENLATPCCCCLAIHLVWPISLQEPETDTNPHASRGLRVLLVESQANVSPWYNFPSSPCDQHSPFPPRAFPMCAF